MAKALLINPSYRDSYGSAKAAIVDPIFPTLSVLTIAAMAERSGHEIKLLDLSYVQYDHRVVRDEIARFKPDVVGVTATTPLMNQLRDISVLAKSVSKNILVVGGGAHVSAMPAESLQESLLDVVVAGEGDRTFAELLDGGALSSIRGIHYRTDSGLASTAPRPFVENLDDLPLPAWHLYDSAEYKHRISRILARRRPLAMAEFSRGCVYKCSYCASKNTMALGYRKKSPERCAEEVRAMHRHGYREFALADDIFTSDNKWAQAVAEAIIKTGIDMPWTCTNGIRVESANAGMFRVMRKAGCYRVSFGLESGNDDVLKASGKGGHASIAQGRKAVKAARSAGIDANGFFMLGLPTDTEQTMKDTVDYAASLPLDMLKFGVAIAFPGTKMFAELRAAKLVRSYNWDDYFIYTTKPMFAHPNLTYERLAKFMTHAHRKAILWNPAFILRRFWRGLRTLEFFWDVYYFVRFVSAPSSGKPTHSANYFARESWPTYDFEHLPIRSYPVRRSNNVLEPEAVSGVLI